MQGHTIPDDLLGQLLQHVSDQQPPDFNDIGKVVCLIVVGKGKKRELYAFLRSQREPSEAAAQSYDHRP